MASRQPTIASGLLDATGVGSMNELGSNSTKGTPTAADIMTAAPRTCSPFSTLTEAALIFRDEDCGVVPVLDGGTPVGILTDRDIALALTRHLNLHDLPVSQVMTKDDLAIVSTDADLAAIERSFATAKVHRVLVTDASGHLAGIIALSDLALYLSSEGLGRVHADVDQRSPVAGGGTVPQPGTNRPHSGSSDRGHAKTWSWARPGTFWNLLRTTAREWSEDKVPRLGAALAFYSVLSIAPLLLIAIAVAATLYGEEAASGKLVDQIQGMVGKQGAEAIQEMLKNAHKPGSGIIASLVGFATLLFAASGVFGQLQDSLNTIWEVQPKAGRGILGAVKDRFVSFLMVLGIGFLLLTSLVLSTTVAASSSLLSGLAPSLRPLLQFGDLFVSAIVVTLLFAMIYKLLPDVKIAWSDVWVGAGLTTALFLIGKALIGAYLGRSGYGSAYGAAGSLVVLLVWIYYSSQILFFGAEFTKVYANSYGRHIEPASDAEFVSPHHRAQQGIVKA